VVGRLSAYKGNTERVGDRLALIEVFDEHERLLVAVGGQQVPDLLDLRGVLGGEPTPLPPVGAGVLVAGHLVAPRDVPDLHFRLLDEAGLEQLVPVGADRSTDQGVYLLLAAGLADRGGREAEAVFRLQFGGP